VVADVGRKRPAHSRTRNWMRLGPRHDRAAQTPLAHAPVEPDLEVHAPRLVLSVEMQIELV
jgi:hypothetical protein